MCVGLRHGLPRCVHCYAGGPPRDKAQHIYRVGRTVRSGKSGVSVLLLTKHDERFLKELCNRPAQARGAGSSAGDAAAIATVLAVTCRLKPVTISMGVSAMFSLFSGSMKRLGWSAADLVAVCDDFSTADCGAPERPSLQAKTFYKIGLWGGEGVCVEGRGRATVAVAAEVAIVGLAAVDRLMHAHASFKIKTQATCALDGWDYLQAPKSGIAPNCAAFLERMRLSFCVCCPPLLPGSGWLAAL